MEKLNLFMYLFKKSKITPKRLSIIAIGVEKIIIFYSLRYLHRDLKNSNILFDNDFLHHIFDYGGAHEYNQSAVNTLGTGTFF
jgi:serine/threonine protein kinase